MAGLDLTGPLRKFLFLALPAATLTAIVSLGLVELWVRASWDHRRGTPGFYESDPARLQRLAAGYNGWFAGVPVRINSLGFRDIRDYGIEKSANTFRILMLGDSVTFGHGAIFETTYPFLLEQRLRNWRPDRDWQVWNLGVPGYNTRQELLYLQEVGPRFQPDLVVVGFYPNDLDGNGTLPAVTPMRRFSSGVQRLMQRHLYSYEFYKRIYLTLRWKLLTDDADRRRIEHLATESELLSSDALDQRSEQKLSRPDYFDDEDVRNFRCIGAPPVDTESPGELSDRIHRRDPDIVPWLDAVEATKTYARQSRYPLVFFINMAPNICGGQDRFYDAGALAEDNVLLEVLGRDQAAASSARAFLHFRPSQMPQANGHSLGNANQVKADVLFELLRSAVLPSLLAPAPTQQ